MSMDILKHSVDNRKRSLDRRRETSRHAARDRRGKEADIFTDLKDVVPVVEESTVTHVDRIALLRVAATLCRLRKHVDKLFDKERYTSNGAARRREVSTEDAIAESLDGFILIVDADGTVLYVTESVSIYLGLTQTDIIGRSLKDFVHQDDYNAITKQITTEKSPEILETGKNMAIRMKSVISPRGRNLNLKSAIYRTIFGRCRPIQAENQKISVIFASSTPAGQGNVGSVLGSARNSEKPNGTFLTRHTPDMKFTYVSENFVPHRFESKSLLGVSFYDLVHPADIQLVSGSMKELFEKGHTRTPYYRLLGSKSSIAWVQTEAMTVNQTMRGQRGLYVLCLHTLLGLQDEIESFATPKFCDVAFAAQPVKVKTEIEDIADYLGRQPEFVDCMDFTPLIEPVTADGNSLLNLNDYRPAAERRIQPSQMRHRGGGIGDLADVGPSRDSDSPRPAPLSRKNSFDEVLQWLFRDEPESPPPDSTTIRRSDPFTFENDGNTVQQPNRDVFMGGAPNQPTEIRHPQATLQGGIPPQDRRFVEPHQNRCTGVFANPDYRRGREASGRPPAPGPPSRGRSGPRVHPPAAVAVDDTNQLANRAAPTVAHAGYQVEHRTASSRPVSLDRQNGYNPTTQQGPGQAIGGVTGFSPLTSGFTDFSLCSPPALGGGFGQAHGPQQPNWNPSQPARRVSIGAPQANPVAQADGFARVVRPATLSAVPTTGPNAMPGAVAQRPREPRQEPYSNVHAAMFAAGRHNPSQTSTSQQQQQGYHQQQCSGQSRFQQHASNFQLNQQFTQQRPSSALNVNQLPVAENPYSKQNRSNQLTPQQPPRSQNFYQTLQPQPQPTNMNLSQSVNNFGQQQVRQQPCQPVQQQSNQCQQPQQQGPRQSYQNFEDPYPYQECPDHFEGLAPFIATDEMIQLTDIPMMDLLPGFSDYTQATEVQQNFLGQPAARPVLNYDKQAQNGDFCPHTMAKRARPEFPNEYNNVNKSNFYPSVQPQLQQNSNVAPTNITNNSNNNLGMRQF